MKQSSLLLLRRSVRSNHNRIVTCGILVCLFYLPTWLSTVVDSIVQGSSETLLNFGFIYLGCRELWRKRRQLALYQPAEEDRLLGYLLILSGSAIFPLCLSSISLQALLCLLIWFGIVLCTWGLAVFRHYSVPLLLLLVSVYPRLVFAGETVRITLTANRLESWMAWLGSLWFQALGQAAVAQGQVLSLSTELIAEKSVKVGSGCSGFDMAFVLAGIGLMLGLWFQQPWLKTALLILLGMTLALVFNVPRIMLLAIAVVYWGQASFDFWHGPIGGQIFSTLLLTCYYYGAMALIHRWPSA
jgi:exosortase/archaeosortase family protein